MPIWVTTLRIEQNNAKHAKNWNVKFSFVFLTKSKKNRQIANLNVKKRYFKIHFLVLHINIHGNLLEADSKTDFWDFHYALIYIHTRPLMMFLHMYFDLKILLACFVQFPHPWVAWVRTYSLILWLILGATKIWKKKQKKSKEC